MSTSKETIDWYNQNAADYTTHVRNPEDSKYHAYYEKPAIYALLPTLNGKRVISLGCGSGEDSEYMKKFGAAESVGIDISSELITIAQKSYADCEFKIMDMEKLDFPDASFDFAYSSLAIHYIKDWTKVFHEVHRILKPGSYFLFSCMHPVKCDVNATYLQQNYFENLLGKLTVGAWRKPLGDIVQYAREAGFSIENIVEPKPLEAMKAIKQSSYEKLTKVPEFIIFRLQKLP